MPQPTRPEPSAALSEPRCNRFGKGTPNADNSYGDQSRPWEKLHNLNSPSITVDVHDVELVLSDDERQTFLDTPVTLDIRPWLCPRERTALVQHFGGQIGGGRIELFTRFDSTARGAFPADMNVWKALAGDQH